MAITSEEQAACDPKLSAKEVTEALRRCRPLPDKRHYDPDAQFVDFGLINPRPSYLLSKWGIPNRSFRAEIISLSDPLSNNRRTLRKKFLKWLLDSAQGWSLFWISDPFLIEENPIVVQVFAGILEEVCRLGAIAASWFHFRTERVILAIIHQLVMKYPPFRRLVLKELINDPTILTKSPCTIFKRLIVQPWDVLACTHPFYLENPPVIVIILGWNQRSSEVTDSDLAKLISEYSKIHRRSPLLWLVSSHPHDPHIKSLSSTVGIGVRSCEYHVLSTSDAEAKEDVYDILRDGFQDIRTHYSSLPKDEVWPTEDQFTHLTTFTSGHYMLAHTTLRFIGADGGDPKQRLEAWVNCTIDSPAPPPSSSSHNLCVYHYRFLQRLLIEFAPDAIPFLFISTIGGFFVEPSNRAAAHLVGLSQSEYYRVLEGIRCLLVDPSDDAQLEFCDEGFKYFFHWGIQRGIDSDTFFPTSARLQVLKRCLDILGCARISFLLETMRWSTSTPHDDFRTINRLRRFAYSKGSDWHLWGGQQGGLGAHHFRSFDFRSLVGKVLFSISMYGLVQDLKTEPMLQDFVRTDPLTTLDQQFIDKCKGVAIPTNFGDVFSKASMVTEYVLLGHGDQTVLALFTWILEFDERRRSLNISGSSVSIYSSDMLEEI